MLAKAIERNEKLAIENKAQAEALAEAAPKIRALELISAGKDTLTFTQAAKLLSARCDGWERDLSAKIQARAEGLVRKEAVRSEVRTERTASERQIVEANAQGVADVLNFQHTHRNPQNRHPPVPT